MSKKTVNQSVDVSANNAAKTLQQSLKADSAFFSYFNRESKVRKEKFAAGRRLSRKVLDFQSLDKKTFTLRIISDAINYKVGDF